MSRYRPVDSAQSFPALEDQVLERWKELDVFHETMRRREGAPLFVFSERDLRAKAKEMRGAFKKRWPRVRLAWSYKTNLLLEASKLAEMDGKADQKAQLDKQRDEAQKRTSELSVINQKKKEEEEAKKAATPAKK